MGSSVCCCSEGPSCSLQWRPVPLLQPYTKVWHQFLSLSLVTGARGPRSNPAAPLCCLRTSSSEAKLPAPAGPRARDRSAHARKEGGKRQRDIRTSLIHCDPKVWPIFLIIKFYCNAYYARAPSKVGVHIMGCILIDPVGRWLLLFPVID